MIKSGLQRWRITAKNVLEQRIMSKKVRFHVVTETSMKLAVFWDVTPCSLVYNNQRFRCRCSLVYLGDCYQNTKRNFPDDSRLLSPWRLSL
jgi:hypothetical protein